jgi:hypothetical protein
MKLKSMHAAEKGGLNDELKRKLKSRFDATLDLQKQFTDKFATLKFRVENLKDV